MISNASVIKPIVPIHNNHNKSAFQLLPDDSYGGRCGTIYITMQGYFIYHCALCPERYGQLQEYWAHLQLKHFPDKEFHEWPVQNHDDDDYHDECKAELEYEEQFAIQQLDTIATEIVLLPEEHKPEEIIRIEVLGLERPNASSDTELVLENLDVSQDEHTEIMELESINIEEETKPPELKQEIGAEPGLLEVQTTNHALNLVTVMKCEIEDNSNEEPALKSAVTEIVEQVHKCNTCGKEFGTRKRWYAHQVTHSTVRRHLCAHCGAAFKEPSHLRKHMVRHDPEAKYSCEVCGKRFNANASRIIHMRTHTGERPFACDQCDYAATTNQVLKHHKSTKHEGVLYSCELCQKRVTSKRGLKKHMQRHEEQKKKGRPARAKQSDDGDPDAMQFTDMYKCNKCEKVFTKMKQLRMHMACHEERKFKCHLCSTAFALKTNLDVHLRRHSKVLTWCCTYCPKKFCTSTELKQHKRVHTGEKPYICPTCGMTFRISGSLTSHIKFTHERVRNFKCDLCEMHFLTKLHLRIHMQVHDRTLRKHACELCEKVFAKKYQLNQHMKIHENARDYKCEFCDAAYNQHAVLKSHIKTKHGC